MADLDALTPRQREIYNFIRSKIQGRGYGPTVREIGLHLRDQEPQWRHVPSEGPAEKGADSSRAEHVAGHPVAGRPGQRHHMGLKLLGRIAAGQPIEAIEQHEELTFSDWTEPATSSPSRSPATR